MLLKPVQSKQCLEKSPHITIGRFKALSRFEIDVLLQLRVQKNSLDVELETIREQQPQGPNVSV